MARYLVTGGTGFLGRPLIDRLLKQNHEVITIARDESKFLHIPNAVTSIAGDITDSNLIKWAIIDNKVDGIFHLAASKHVGLSEKQPLRTVQTNVTGTSNLINWASRSAELKFFLSISTDKAAQISGVYGASKFLMEKLLIEAQQKHPRIKFRTVRYGNVLYSTGSVLCKWKEALQKGDEVTITDPNATRFFWTVDQAIDLIFECLEKATDATPYIPRMKAMRMGDLLSAMEAKYGPAKKVNVIGLQIGENKHESMDGKIFSNQVDQYTIDEILELI